MIERAMMRWAAIRASAVELAAGLAILAVAGVTLAACDGNSAPGRDASVFYRPPTAAIAERADCLAPDIDSALSELNYGSIDSGRQRAAGVGYPPAEFTPVAVVRCERGENDAGAMTIDIVRLEGDVDAAWEAFRVDSERFPDGVMASCIFEVSPVGIWFVDADGRAVRPAWPGAPCGFQDRPLAVLADLHEVDRQQHAKQLPADNPGVCSEQYGSGFSTTTDTDSRVTETVTDRRARLTEGHALAFPIDDVGRLRVCRYAESADNATQQSRSRLTTLQSIDLVREVVEAPVAPPCSLTATRTAHVPLYRPDGSGGAQIDIELDGCRRATGMGIPYVAVPATVTAVVDEPHP